MKGLILSVVYVKNDKSRSPVNIASAIVITFMYCSPTVQGGRKWRGLLFSLDFYGIMNKNGEIYGVDKTRRKKSMAYASILISSGTDIVTISKQLGHADVNTTVGCCSP